MNEQLTLRELGIRVLYETGGENWGYFLGMCKTRFGMDPWSSEAKTLIVPTEFKELFEEPRP